MEPTTLANVLELIERGVPLTEFPQARHNRRIDLRGCDLATLGSKRHFGAPAPPLAQGPLGEFTKWFQTINIPLSLRGITLRDIDFAKCKLDHMRCFECTIDNCVFDQASCSDWRMWATTVSNCSFARATLRESGLGGIFEGKANRFDNVSFIRTDLRRTAHGVASFVDCIFDHANLCGVGFHGTRFSRCVFRGELYDVMFFEHGYGSGQEDFPPNEMEDVDFSEATLRYVKFGGLKLERVRWPEDDNHIVIRNYDAALDRMVAQVTGKNDEFSNRVRRLVEVERTCGGTIPEYVSVFNRGDLIKQWGDNGAAEFENLLRSCAV
jgi:uncharacterized protein YjbI with pentapeptide repeats